MGKFLKVCLSILACEVTEPKFTFSYKDGQKWDKFKDGEVKRTTKHQKNSIILKH